MSIRSNHGTTIIVDIALSKRNICLSVYPTKDLPYCLHLLYALTNILLSKKLCDLLLIFLVISLSLTEMQSITLLLKYKYFLGLEKVKRNDKAFSTKTKLNPNK
jgi:hypothetical protein